MKFSQVWPCYCFYLTLLWRITSSVTKHMVTVICKQQKLERCYLTLDVCSNAVKYIFWKYLVQWIKVIQGHQCQCHVANWKLPHNFLLGYPGQSHRMLTLFCVIFLFSSVYCLLIHSLSQSLTHNGHQITPLLCFSSVTFPTFGNMLVQS